MTFNVENIKEKLKYMLDASRYEHSLGTADTAKALARHWHLDEKKAYVAGLIHDCAKCYAKEGLVEAALSRGIKVDDWYRMHPGLLHGPLAAAELTETWGIADAEIAECIRCHTVPEPDMGELAKIVYLADKIEPNREEWTGLKRLRELAYEDLDLAMIAAIDAGADFVLRRGKTLHPATEEIRQIYRNKIKNIVKRESGKSFREKEYGGQYMAQISADALLKRCVELATEKKGRDMVSLKLLGLTLICDYFLVVTAANTRQAQAICDNIHEEMKREGIAPLRIEGYREGRWILVDFGAVVVHVFLEEEREYYNLERLWGDAEKVEY